MSARQANGHAQKKRRVTTKKEVSAAHVLKVTMEMVNISAKVRFGRSLQITEELSTEGVSIGSWLNVAGLGFSHFLNVLIGQQRLSKPLIWQIFYIQAPC